MGGLFIMTGILAALLLFGDWNNGYMTPVLVVACGLTSLGVLDDVMKLRMNVKGLSARKKLLGQLVVAAAAAWLLYQQQAAVPEGLMLHVPFSSHEIALGLWFIPLAVLVIVSASNAVNLADGLDGLAGGCLICTTIAIGILTYAGGHAEWAEYLHVPHIPHAGEMTILAGGMIGGVLGFLWFNCHPAQVFMGNTGALPLGGLLGVLAVIARQEGLFILIAAVFVAEALSVIMQVGYFKWCGRRLFRCAPLHHHFQFLGWPENKIVVRFWIASALCALVGIASLRLGVADPNVSPGNAHHASLNEDYVVKSFTMFSDQRERIDTGRAEARTGWRPSRHANLVGNAHVLEDEVAFPPADGVPPHADLPGFDRRMDLPSREPTQAATQAMQRDILRK
jgi:phospho-N-acetylmuramoyl-pentapeptide-transferase